MSKSEAGRLGGTSTFKKYGKKHMREIGRLGAQSFWNKYFLTPVGTANFAIVERSTGKVIGTMAKWRP